MAQSGEPIAIVKVGTAEPVEYKDLHTALVAGSAAGSVVELIDNVDLSGKNWEPIAGFAGTFDGKGYIVSNLTITAADVSGNYAGLFSQLSSDAAVVRNLTFENVSLHAENSEYLGTIVGHIDSASPAISNITVCGKIDLLGKKYVGGIAGFLYFGGLVDCHVDGGNASESTLATLGKQCGGINGTYVSGSDGNMTCYDCTVKNVTITGPEQLGGLTGRAFRLASYVNCSVEDVIIKATKSTTAIGGLIGDVYNAYGHGRFLIGCSTDNVSLQDGTGAEVTYVDFGTDNTIDYLMVSDDAEAENFATFAKWNYGFTAGTFTDVGGDGNMVAALEANCAEGYEVVDNGDNTYTVQQIPLFDITITAPENGTLETSVTNGIVAGTTVTVTATPATGFELESITTNGIALAEGVTTFEMPAEDVTVSATFVSAGPTYPPTWPMESTYTEAFGTWAGKYDLSKVDLTTAAAQKAFLMNADPTATLPELKIESIEVEGTTATIVVGSTVDLATINGVLYVDSSDDLATWTTEEIDVATAANIDKATGKATFTISAGKFMKAKVGFVAPADPSAE